jgi:gamma-glutamyl-gamma-aminobutyraldehyde dehydrogenase
VSAGSTELQAAILAEASRPIPPAMSWIDGRAVEAASGRRLARKSPIDETGSGSIPACDQVDVDRAVAAARRAYADRRWVGLGRRDRKQILLRFAERVSASRLELGVLQCRDMGMPVRMAIEADAGEAAATLRWYAEALDKLTDEMLPLTARDRGYVARVPLGVVGAILPWNFPLMIAAWKLGPALAAGNSVVVKPAEAASLAICRLGALAAQAGLPDGVLNIVTGSGQQVGEPLARHQDVDCITFTGSGEVGRKLLEFAGQSNLKRVSLECGGKTANIVLEDAPNLEEAAQTAARAIFRNQGQICNAPSRLLVQRTIYQDFVARVANIARSLKIGSPLQIEVDMGPVVSEQQRQAVRHALAEAERAGARLLLDGRTAPCPQEGYYIGPSIAVDVDPQSTLAQEEVFGPVLAVIPFDTLDEAIRIANGTRYALGAAIWTRDIDKAQHAATHLVAGSIYVNACGGVMVEMPFGGFRESGFGRDRSLHAFDKYTDLKAVMMRHTPPA